LFNAAAEAVARANMRAQRAPKNLKGHFETDL
jgi:hypothetical protein